MGESHISASFDLSALGLLPSNWIEDILQLAEQQAIFVHLDGKTETSLEPNDTVGTDYEVVPGDVVRNRLGWLYELYIGELLRLAAAATGVELVPANNLRYGVNINKLTGMGARYEWHVDSNPVTGILFVTSHPATEGGELMLRLEDEEILVPPISGHFFVFSAGKIPHAVAPLKKITARVSVPMSYFGRGEAQIIDSLLEEYLFGRVETNS